MTTPEPISYNIKPTKLIPNSPKPLLLYKGCFLLDNGEIDLRMAYDTFTRNGWDVQWVNRYGHYQLSHYHPKTHEVMVVVSGPGTIRWGAADLDNDAEKHTYGDAYEQDCLQFDVDVGDVFVIPAGVAHKSFDVRSKDLDVVGLTGGSGHWVEAQDPRRAVGELRLSGFMMMGAYPKGNGWSWGTGGDDLGDFEGVWNLPNPEADPVVGGQGGIGRYWG